MQNKALILLDKIATFINTPMIKQNKRSAKVDDIKVLEYHLRNYKEIYYLKNYALYEFSLLFIGISAIIVFMPFWVINYFFLLPSYSFFVVCIVAIIISNKLMNNFFKNSIEIFENELNDRKAKSQVEEPKASN